MIDRIRAILREDQLVSRVTSDLRASNDSITTEVWDTQDAIAAETLRVFNTDGPISFVEKLYRNRNSFADRLSDEQLDWIHVDLGLDEFIINAVDEGRQLIITGNPGDGKTFIIQRLRATLEAKGAMVFTDANACSDTEVLAAWRTCDEKRLPFVLAINEWPLFELQRLARQEGFTPVDEAIRQVQDAIYYGRTPEPEVGRVTVVDLNLRNVLATPVTTTAVQRLTADRFVDQLDELDPAKANVTRLRHERVQERLGALLQQASRRGDHTTMRQLMGYVAYIITGGTGSTQRFAEAKDTRFVYANLAFDGGEGPMFNLVRTCIRSGQNHSPQIRRGTLARDNAPERLGRPVRRANRCSSMRGT